MIIPIGREEKPIDMVIYWNIYYCLFLFLYEKIKLIETFYESMAILSNSLGKVLKSMVFLLKSLGKVSISFETLSPISLLIL